MEDTLESILEQTRRRLQERSSTNLSREELLKRGAEIAAELNKYGLLLPYAKDTRTLQRVYITAEGKCGRLWRNGSVEPEYSIESLAQIVKNGERRLHNLKQRLELMYAKFPELVAEGAFSKLEGDELIRFVFERKLVELGAIFEGTAAKHVFGSLTWWLPVPLGGSKKRFILWVIFRNEKILIRSDSPSVKEALLFLNNYESVQDYMQRMKNGVLKEEKCVQVK
jgi:hypothetical protein